MFDELKELKYFKEITFIEIPLPLYVRRVFKECIWKARENLQ